MTFIRYTACAVALMTLLAGCSNVTQTEPTVGGAFASSISGLLEGQADPVAKPVVTREQFASIADPLILVTLEDVDALASAVRVSRNGAAETYQGAADISLTLTDGIITATRGYSDDLMQSDLTAMRSALKRGQGTYRKSMSYLTSQDQLRTLVFRCELRDAGRDVIAIVGKLHRTRRLEESCRENGRQIDNTYWVEGARTVKSRQWVADGVSRMMIEQIQ